MKIIDLPSETIKRLLVAIFRGFIIENYCFYKIYCFLLVCILLSTVIDIEQNAGVQLQFVINILFYAIWNSFLIFIFKCCAIIFSYYCFYDVSIFMTNYTLMKIKFNRVYL